MPLLLFLLKSCFSSHITSARIEQVIPLDSQGEFFVVTQEQNKDGFFGFLGWHYTYNSQRDILRCFNEITKEDNETICFSVFDTYDAIDMAEQKDNSGAEISVLRKR